MKVHARDLFTVLILMIITFSSTCAFAVTTNFIPAPNRVDMVYDDTRGVLYITSGSSVLRYKIATDSFLTPYDFSLGNLSGIDLSPDGNTLAIADRNICGIHLIDLQTDTIKPDINFTPAYGEGGSFTVAYGSDGALLVTTQYNGSGWVPLRRVDPQTGVVTTINKGTTNPTQVRQNTMLSGSADGKCIGYAESNSSDGPIGIYDVTSQKITKFLQLTSGTNASNYEIGTNRDCTQFAVPTYQGTFIYDNTLAKLGTIGVYAGGQPIGVAYHPTADIVYFAWVGTSTVRAYDSKTFAQLASFDVGYTFQNPGNYAFNEGRLKASRDGSLLFATVGNGIRYLRTALNPVANDQSLFINTTAPTAITLSGSSPKQLPLSYTVVTQPAHGTLQGTAPSLTYTPDPDYSGQDSFTFKVSDGTQESTPATVTIIIDKASPSITLFTLPSTSSTLTVPITAFTATDNVGVTGYCISESANPASCAWTSISPTSYRFGGIGTQTLYAFARDAAGNVSDPSSASVEIPEIVPRITAFSIPPTYGYTSLTIPVTLTASDDIGVTGYCIVEVADPSACIWNSWAPTSYILATPGPHTLYAFAKNTTGKVSPPVSAATTVVGQVNFIPAPSRIDMVYDSARDVVYITSGTSVLRYKLGTNAFLPPYTFGLGNLSGIDLSPDGNTLAIADRNITGIHLIDLQTDTIMPNITFAPYLSGEGGTFTVAYGSDGALLVTSTYNGSGWAPLRRIVPDTGEVKIIKTIVSQDSMLSGSADGKCIGYVEGNISSGPVSIYDVATQTITKTANTNWFAYEVGTNRDCTQFAVPTYGGTFIYDNTLTKLGTIGVYASGQPIGVAYHPTSDLVYFAWAGSREVRVYDSKTFSQVGAIDVGYTFQNAGNHAFGQGRLKTSRDGSLLFATIQDGVRYQRLSTDAPVADDQTVTSYAGAPLSITITGSSPNRAALAFTVLTQPSHGSIQGTAPNLIYTPDAAYSGVDTITFKISDGTLDSNNATLTIIVKPDVANVNVQSPTVKGQLTISWNNPVDPNFSHVHLYRSTAQGQGGSLVGDNLTSGSYVDNGLSSLTTYYYTVHAVDKAGFESTNTTQVFQTTLDASPPLTISTIAGGIYTSSQSVGLVCYDGAGSGCASTYYCLGASCTPTIPYTGDAITIASSTDLRFYSIDQSGNNESVKTASYVIQPHKINVTPAFLNFGASLLYYPEARTVTIANAGSLTLVTSTPLAITGPDSSLFSVAPGGPAPCPSLNPTIGAGQSCTVTVTFTPETSGAKQAYLHIVSTADNSPILDVSLTGLGVPPMFLTTKLTGEGTINNIAQPPAFSCGTPSCTAPFAAGTSMILRATPSSRYSFSGWSGGGCSDSSDCALTLTTDTTVTAIFAPLPLVQIDGNNKSYPTFATALADVLGNATFRARNVTFSENINLDRSLDIFLAGGFEEDFSTVDGYTRLQGTLTIGRGSLTVDGLAIQ